MSKFRKAFGANLRDIRLSRGLTQAELVNRMVELGHEPFSDSLLGHWETGRRTASAEDLMFISRALSCPYSELYKGIDPRIERSSIVERMMVEFKALPEDAQQIMLSTATAFEGDKLAVIRYLKLCHLELPREYRREVISYGIHMREKAEASGVVKKSAWMDYLLIAWRKLY